MGFLSYNAKITKNSISNHEMGLEMPFLLPVAVFSAEWEQNMLF